MVDATQYPVKQSEGIMINAEYIKIQLILKLSRIELSNSELMDDIRLIGKDIDRTGFLIELNKDSSFKNDIRIAKLAESLRNILITFAAFNQHIETIGQKNSLGYAQG